MLKRLSPAFRTAQSASYIPTPGNDVSLNTGAWKRREVCARGVYLCLLERACVFIGLLVCLFWKSIVSVIIYKTSHVNAHSVSNAQKNCDSGIIVPHSKRMPSFQAPHIILHCTQTLTPSWRPDFKTVPWPYEISSSKKKKNVLPQPCGLCQSFSCGVRNVLCIK